MSVTESVKHRIARVPRGEPFTSSRFLRLGSRSAVDKALSRLVEKGAIQRIARGVFVRPKQSRFVGNVMPDVSRVIQVIAKDHGEIVQVHAGPVSYHLYGMSHDPHELFAGARQRVFYWRWTGYRLTKRQALLQVGLTLQRTKTGARRSPDSASKTTESRRV